MKACIYAFSERRGGAPATQHLRELADQGLAWSYNTSAVPSPSTGISSIQFSGLENFEHYITSV